MDDQAQSAVASPVGALVHETHQSVPVAGTKEQTQPGLTAVPNGGAEAAMPFQFRGSGFTMMVLRILDPDDSSFFAKLDEKVRQAPNFFKNAPLVLDFESLAPDRCLHLSTFVRRLRAFGLFPIGVHGGTPLLRDTALTLGLPPFPAGRAAKMDAEAPASAPPAQPPTPAPPTPPMIISEPIRSGRQVYARHTDLIVLSSVSPGAEVLADGSIHIYGPLRGRALAGLTGTPSARIFCMSLEAEMVSIAGLYRVNEDIDPDVFKKPAQILLEDGYLTMKVMPQAVGPTA